MSVTRLNIVLPPTLRPSDADYGRERYDTAQAALYLCVSRDVIYTAIKTHSLSHRRHASGRGGRVRFSQADLDAWRQAQRVESAPTVLASVGIRPRPARVAELRDLMPKERAFA